MFLRKPLCPYFGDKQEDGCEEQLQKAVDGGLGICLLPLEATGPGEAPQGCRADVGMLQKSKTSLSCQQLKIRCISAWLEQPGQTKGLKGGQSGQTWKNKTKRKQYSLNPYYEKLDIFAQFNGELYFDVRKH